MLWLGQPLKMSFMLELCSLWIFQSSFFILIRSFIQFSYSNLAFFLWSYICSPMLSCSYARTTWVHNRNLTFYIIMMRYCTAVTRLNEIPWKRSLRCPFLKLTELEKNVQSLKMKAVHMNFVETSSLYIFSISWDVLFMLYEILCPFSVNFILESRKVNDKNL